MALNRKHFTGHDKMLILDQENNENTCDQYHHYELKTHENLVK